MAQYRTRNGKAFGPYWFRVWREGGKLRKAYVKPDDVEAVRLACKVHRSRSKSPKENARAWASWKRKEDRASRDFCFLVECWARCRRGLPLHYTQERKARRIMGMEAE